MFESPFISPQVFPSDPVKKELTSEKSLQCYGLFKDGYEWLGTFTLREALPTHPTCWLEHPLARISTSPNDVKLLNPLYSKRFAGSQIKKMVNAYLH
jgi:hypothetical protein